MALPSAIISLARFVGSGAYFGSREGFMRKIIMTATIAAMSFAAIIGTANASAGPFPFRATAGMTGGDDSQGRARSALSSMLDAFVEEDYVSRSSVVAAADPAAESNGECPEDKETKVAEAEKAKGAAKDKAPVGPEPIYFAF